MTLDEFRHHAEAWGGRLDRWPEDLRVAARLLAERSSAARGVLAEAKWLDDRLDMSADLAVTHYRARAAASKVMARIAEAERAQAASWWQTPIGWLLPAGGFAVAAALGIALAIMAQPPQTRRETILISAIVDSGGLAEDLVVE